MLYGQIRYAEPIRKLYRLRHLLVQRDHPDLGSRLGYSKYSKQFYRVKRILLEDGILDKQGRFVENLPNLWLVELPLHAKNKKQMEVLGYRVPYNIFLAIVTDPPKKAGQLSEELNFNRKAVYDAVDKLESTGLVSMENSVISAEKEEPFYNWILRYMELCKTHADTTDDISILFTTVPAYISGPQAYYIINYKSGRPIGPADMMILTYKPFIKFWERIINEIRYFRDYPKKIEIGIAKPTDNIVWIDRLPYSKRAKITLRV